MLVTFDPSLLDSAFESRRRVTAHLRGPRATNMKDSYFPVNELDHCACEHIVDGNE